MQEGVPAMEPQEVHVAKGTQCMIQGAGARRAQRDGKAGQQWAEVGLRRTPRTKMS